MGWSPLTATLHETAPYDLNKDIQFFQDKPVSLLTVQPGTFAVFFPWDVHAPGIGEGSIKKAVVKVLVNY
jgi:YhcH/YjgK/YiaL family protein